jgi:DNA polymerase III delta prime subunit
MPTLNMLWVEKHRPKELSELVLEDNTRATLEKWLEAGEIPHALLVGITGSGKTTIARILIDKLDCAVLSLNASDDRGIETVRTRVKNFLQAASRYKWKIVFLDEADQLTPDAQGALRNIIERYSSRGRFLLTANYEDKLIEAIRSRCQTLYFRPIEQKLVVRKLKELLDLEKVEYELTDLVQIVSDCYPDIRLAINHAQRCVLNNRLTYEQMRNAGLEIVELLRGGKLREIRLLIAQEKPDFNDLYRTLFDVCAGRFEKIEPPVPRAITGQALITVAEYAYRDAIVIDRELQFAACCQKLMGLAGR